MSFFDFYSRFFNDSGNPRFPEDEENENFDDSGSSYWKSDDLRDFGSIYDFKIMTDPFEMHRYFEERFSEIFKMFNSPEGFPGFQGLDLFERPTVPAIEEKSKDPKEHCLKPGLHQSQPKRGDIEDDKNKGTGPITSWLDSFTPPSPDTASPSKPRVFSSFKSVVRKTVTLPDGTVKTEEIIRNSDGTEKRTESQTLPDERNSPFFNSPSGQFISPDFFNQLREPTIRTDIPKYHFLKPGYERLSPHGEKVDKDIDKEVLQSGIDNLPPLNKNQMAVEEPANRGFITRSFTRRTTTLPNGVIESEEVIRNADGTEQRTVTQTLPDGTVTSREASDGPLVGPPTSGDGHKVALSFALKGFKDFIDMIFK